MEYIIGITGKRLSGKTTVADHISKKFGFVHLDFTKDVLLPLLMKENKDISRINLADMATHMRHMSGNDILTRIICEHVREEKNYVIGGLRFSEEAEYLRSTYTSRFKLVSIEASDVLRHKRALSRRDKEEDTLSFEEFIEMESLPTEKPVPDLMSLADFTIVNGGTEAELKKKVDRVMEQILSH